MKIKKTTSTIIFQVLSTALILAIALVCVLPIIMVLAGSLSDNLQIAKEGYSILPRGFSTEAYATLWENSGSIIRAYGVTIAVTVLGTLLSLTLITMVSYVISRRDYKYRNIMTFIFYFTTLFNGGMVSTYIYFIKYYNLKDNLLAIILPSVMNVFYLLVMRSFMAEVPTELLESAKIDGAGDFKIFVSIVLPLVKSGIATIGLFVALEYWNEWYNTMLYISSNEKYTLQYLLYNMLSSAQGFAKMAGSAAANVQLPTQTMKLAMTVIATGPIILVYPFVQKYFVKGVTVGAVKG